VAPWALGWIVYCFFLAEALLNAPPPHNFFFPPLLVGVTLDNSHQNNWFFFWVEILCVLESIDYKYSSKKFLKLPFWTLCIYMSLFHSFFCPWKRNLYIFLLIGNEICAHWTYLSLSLSLSLSLFWGIVVISLQVDPFWGLLCARVIGLDLQTLRREPLHMPAGSSSWRLVVREGDQTTSLDFEERALVHGNKK